MVAPQPEFMDERSEGVEIVGNFCTVVRGNSPELTPDPPERHNP